MCCTAHFVRRVFMQLLTQHPRVGPHSIHLATLYIHLFTFLSVHLFVVIQQPIWFVTLLHVLYNDAIVSWELACELGEEHTNSTTNSTSDGTDAAPSADAESLLLPPSVGRRMAILSASFFYTCFIMMGISVFVLVRAAQTRASTLDLTPALVLIVLLGTPLLLHALPEGGGGRGGASEAELGVERRCLHGGAGATSAGWWVPLAAGCFVCVGLWMCHALRRAFQWRERPRALAQQRLLKAGVGGEGGRKALAMRMLTMLHLDALRSVYIASSPP